MQLRTTECDPYGYVFFQQLLTHRRFQCDCRKGRNAHKMWYAKRKTQKLLDVLYPILFPYLVILEA